MVRCCAQWHQSPSRRIALIVQNLTVLSVDLDVDEKLAYSASFKCGLFELAKIELTKPFYEELMEKSEPERKLLLFQMVNTPVAHQVLLGAIATFVEDVKDDCPLDVKESLESWLIQTRELLNPSKTQPQ